MMEAKPGVQFRSGGGLEWRVLSWSVGIKPSGMSQEGSGREEEEGCRSFSIYSHSLTRGLGAEAG